VEIKEQPITKRMSFGQELQTRSTPWGLPLELQVRFETNGERPLQKQRVHIKLDENKIQI
jgi:hypothetical protein